MKRIKRWKLLVGVLVALVIVGALVFRARAQKQAAKLQKTEHPQVQTVEKTVEVSGVVDAKEKATLKFLAGGKVTYLGAQEGDWVKKWQTVASIDKADLQKNLQKYLNLYSIERSVQDQNLFTRKDIHGNKVTDLSNDQDQLSLNNTVLDVELKDIAMKNASLYSPIAGILVSSPTQVAGTILSSTDAFEIVNPSTLFFTANVDESDISLVKEGQLATLTLDAYPQRTLNATVTKIAYKSAETTNGTVFGVEFSIPSEGTMNITYRLGMNGTIKIQVDKKEHVLTVPLRAIIERDDKSYVEVKNADGKIDQREVQIGLENDTLAEITGGLQESDSVVVR